MTEHQRTADEIVSDYLLNESDFGINTKKKLTLNKNLQDLKINYYLQFNNEYLLNKIKNDLSTITINEEASRILFSACTYSDITVHHIILLLKQGADYNYKNVYVVNNDYRSRNVNRNRNSSDNLGIAKGSAGAIGGISGNSNDYEHGIRRSHGDINGNTLLHNLVMHNNYQCINFLIQLGIKNNITNYNNETPLLLLSKNEYSVDQMKCLKLLLTMKYTDVLVEDKHGRSAAFYAYVNKNVWFLRKLLKHHASVLWKDHIDKLLDVQEYSQDKRSLAEIGTLKGSVDHGHAIRTDRHKIDIDRNYNSVEHKEDEYKIDDERKCMEASRSNVNTPETHRQADIISLKAIQLKSFKSNRRDSNLPGIVQHLHTPRTPREISGQTNDLDESFNAVNFRLNGSAIQCIRLALANDEYLCSLMINYRYWEEMREQKKAIDIPKFSTTSSITNHQSLTNSVSTVTSMKSRDTNSRTESSSNENSYSSRHSKYISKYAPIYADDTAVEFNDSPRVQVKEENNLSKEDRERIRRERRLKKSRERKQNSMRQREQELEREQKLREDDVSKQYNINIKGIFYTSVDTQLF